MPAREPQDSEPVQPSLELPSLSGWRRQRRARAEARAAERTEQPVAPPEPVEPEPVEPEPVEPEPVEPEPVEPEPVEPEPVEPEPQPRAVDEVPPPAPAPEEEEPEEPRRRAPRVRRAGGLPAVIGVGVVVGLAVVGLTWAALQTCRLLQGTPSCGTAGYPLLALVLALSAVIGSVLLRLALVPDHVSTSVLGVGLAAVIVVLTLVGRVDQGAMVVVVPVVSALTFAAAHWVGIAATEHDDR